MVCEWAELQQNLGRMAAKSQQPEGGNHAHPAGKLLSAGIETFQVLSVLPISSNIHQRSRSSSKHEPLCINHTPSFDLNTMSLIKLCTGCL